MDQVKKLLSKVVKLQFWIIIALAVLLGVGGFFLASSNYGKLYDTQKSALDKNFGDIKTVSAAIPTHPNLASQEKMAEIINALSEDVRIAWASQYERQAQFLQWPEAINNPLLVSKMKKYYPVEIKLTYPDEPRDVSKAELQTYGTYFDQQMPHLAEIIGVDWIGKANTTAAGGMGGMMGSMGSMMGGMGSMMGGGGSRDEGGSDYGGGGYGGDGGMAGGMGGMMGMGGGSGMGMPGMGMPGMGIPGFANKPPDLVTWRKPSQDELITDIRMWRGDTPTVYEVYYTQENMWILEGLFNIIHKTNGNAIANFQCTIREIMYLRIGKTAVGKAGMIDMPGAMMGGMGGMMGGMMGSGSDMEGGGYGDEAMMEGAGGAGERGGDMAGGMGGEAGGYGSGGYGGEEGMMGGGVRTIDPADRRYVDANFEPVSGDDLRTKMQSSEPADAYFAVAKRVPVRMRLRIDQRKIQEFLANCGNADLMFEVNQVRLGDTSPAPVGGMGGSMMGGMMGGMMSSMMGGMSGGGMGGGGMGGGGMGGGSSRGRGDDGGGGYGGGGYGGGSGGGGSGGMMDGGMMGGMMGGTGGLLGMGAARDPWELDIEVYGVVYLFNPVDIKRLGIEKVTEQTELEVTVVPTEEVPLPVPDSGNASVETPIPNEVGTDPAAGPSGEGSQPGANAPLGAGPASGQPRGPRVGGNGPGLNRNGPNASGPNANGPNANGPNANGPNVQGAGAAPQPATPPNQ